MVANDFCYRGSTCTSQPNVFNVAIDHSVDMPKFGGLEVLRGEGMGISSCAGFPGCQGRPLGTNLPLRLLWNESNVNGEPFESRRSDQLLGGVAEQEVN